MKSVSGLAASWLCLTKLAACSIVVLFIVYMSLDAMQRSFTSIGFISKSFQINESFESKDVIVSDDDGYVNIAVLESKCKCRMNEQIVVRQRINQSLNGSVIQVKRVWKGSERAEIKLEMSESEFNKLRFTCDLFNSLRRGLHQRVVGYSLYGTKRFYYDKLKNISSQINNLMPGWITRIHYDQSIDTNIICEIECNTNDINNQTYLDNADFCNVNHLFLSWQDYMKKKEFDAGFMHAMTWRWMPIGDSMVDVFSSRDTDSYILQRELDSVNVWLSSDKPGHIMRDHPQHGTEILGGMWGYRPSKSRKTADFIFDTMTNKKTAASYNSNRQSPKGSDQSFLTHHVYNLMREDSVIHDSYLCANYKGSGPWPTKRVGNCFVGSPVDCNKTATFFVCSERCRPSGHKDWKSC